MNPATIENPYKNVVMTVAPGITVETINSQDRKRRRRPALYLMPAALLAVIRISLPTADGGVRTSILNWLVVAGVSLGAVFIIAELVYRHILKKTKQDLVLQPGDLWRGRAVSGSLNGILVFNLGGMTLNYITDRLTGNIKPLNLPAQNIKSIEVGPKKWGGPFGMMPQVYITTTLDKTFNFLIHDPQSLFNALKSGSSASISQLQTTTPPQISQPL